MCYFCVAKAFREHPTILVYQTRYISLRLVFTFFSETSTRGSKCCASWSCCPNDTSPLEQRICDVFRGDSSPQRVSPLGYREWTRGRIHFVATFSKPCGQLKKHERELCYLACQKTRATAIPRSKQVQRVHSPPKDAVGAGGWLSCHRIGQEAKRNISTYPSDWLPPACTNKL